MSNDLVISDLIKNLVADELAKQAALEDTGSIVKPRLHSPEDLKLAKRVAHWMGGQMPLPTALGKWTPRTDARSYIESTPARLGVGRSGTRYLTETALRFLTDHAAARDAVHSDVDEEIMSKMGVITLNSAAEDKREFLARPDLGRRLSEESVQRVQREGDKGLQVQIVAADGLSATALNVNLPLVLPVLQAEFARLGIRTGQVFAIRNGRVAAADEVARLTGAEVLCLLVGERPGLKTAESMGGYVTYMKVANFNEAMRFVVSNIHQGGLLPEPGGRQVAGLCRKALDEKKTGVDFSA